jgi:hypothetical protein
MKERGRFSLTKADVNPHIIVREHNEILFASWSSKGGKP